MGQVAEVVGVVGLDSVHAMGKEGDLGDEAQALVEELELLAPLGAFLTPEIVVDDDLVGQDHGPRRHGVEARAPAERLVEDVVEPEELAMRTEEMRKEREREIKGQ